MHLIKKLEVLEFPASTNELVYSVGKICNSMYFVALLFSVYILVESHIFDFVWRPDLATVRHMRMY